MSILDALRAYMEALSALEEERISQGHWGAKLD